MTAAVAFSIKKRSRGERPPMAPPSMMPSGSSSPMASSIPKIPSSSTVIVPLAASILNTSPPVVLSVILRPVPLSLMATATLPPLWLLIVSITFCKVTAPSRLMPVRAPSRVLINNSKLLPVLLVVRPSSVTVGFPDVAVMVKLVAPGSTALKISCLPMELTAILPSRSGTSSMAS